MTNEHHEAASDLLDDAASDDSERAQHAVARSQVEATLAVAHELRTANLIALGNAAGGAIDQGRRDILDLVRRGNISEEKGLATLEALDEKQERLSVIQKTVRERLGLPE